MKSRALLIGVLHVKFHGNFPLLQRIWSGDMNVANEVYVLLPIYFRSSLMDKSISSKGICWIPSLWILFIPRNPFAASNGDWLLSIIEHLGLFTPRGILTSVANIRRFQKKRTVHLVITPERLYKTMVTDLFGNGSPIFFRFFF